MKYNDILVLVGSGRSGTTFMATALKLGLRFGFHGEPKFVVQYIERSKKFGDLSDAKNMRRLVEEMIKLKVFVHLEKRITHEAVTAEDILSRIQKPDYEHLVYALFDYLREKRGHLYLAYKDPLDTKYVKQVSTLLPNSKFIHLVRDPRNVVLSTNKINWGATNEVVGAAEWANFTRKAVKDGDLLGPSRYLEIRYEDFLQNTHQCSIQIVEFLFGEKDEEKISAFENYVNSNAKAGTLDKWKKELSFKKIQQIESLCSDLMERFDYPLHTPPVKLNPLTLTFYKATDFVFRGLNYLKRNLGK